MAGTRWIKLDVSYLRNPKIIGLHPQAVMLHLAGILWTADQLTDGHIPDRCLTDLGHQAHIDLRWVRRRASQLVEHHLWLPLTDGWHIHDFEIMNPQAMRKKVEEQRAKWAAQKGYPR
jgi:hypothetical protein